jgi:hypothetical protein
VTLFLCFKGEVGGVIVGSEREGFRMWSGVLSSAASGFFLRIGVGRERDDDFGVWLRGMDEDAMDEDVGGVSVRGGDDSGVDDCVGMMSG